MSALVEVAQVSQREGEPRRRWFASESLDLLVWLDADDAPVGFQLGWQDAGKGHAITAHAGEPLTYERVDEGSRGGAGYARSATLHSAVEDYDLALIQPRFAALSRQLPAVLRDYVLQQLGTPVQSTTATRGQALAGLNVLVTRPLRQARKLLALLEAEGAGARLLPLIAIRPPLDIPAAATLLHTHEQAGAWIFTSANAVAAAHAMRPASHWQAPLYAVGEATAKALADLGHTARRPPPDAIHSEGLLALPTLQPVAGTRVLIVTGEAGRDGLREPLMARGAEVAVANVYRREVVPHQPETIELTLDGVNALLLTSGESLVALHRALPVAQKAALLQLPTVVPSRRVLGMARALGFTQPLLAATVSDAAFVQSLVDWRHTTSA